mmetsp:Transcript_41050/g.131296  ORF Transcript_41050/g.131296 Transcript_41050/m.131296 type:complete len:242 (+) Transcript_41050:107-832(+)
MDSSARATASYSRADSRPPSIAPALQRNGRGHHLRSGRDPEGGGAGPRYDPQPAGGGTAIRRGINQYGNVPAPPHSQGLLLRRVTQGRPCHAPLLEPRVQGIKRVRARGGGGGGRECVAERSYKPGRDGPRPGVPGAPLRRPGWRGTQASGEGECNVSWPGSDLNRDVGRGGPRTGPGGRHARDRNGAPAGGGGRSSRGGPPQGPRPQPHVHRRAPHQAGALPLTPRSSPHGMDQRHRGHH